jgi:hypothetical protein
MITEKWQCTHCGKEAPCKLEVSYTDVKLPEHVKGKLRFTKKICVCNEYPTPAWELLDVEKVGEDEDGS